MNLRTTMIGLFLASALAISASPSARATTLAEMSEEQLTDASTYIVRGKIVDVWTEVDDRGLVWTRASLEVHKTLKGPDDPDFLVIDSMGGVYGERQMIVPSSARFSEGEEVLLFLDTIDFGRKLAPVSMFRGKLALRRAPGETRKHAMRWNSESLDYDGRFLPHPPRDQRLYLDDLEERIERRLDAGWDGKAIPGLTESELLQINTPEMRKRR